jgi:hypothetical protein
LTTFAAAWVTQRQQANVQWFLQEKTRRQELYRQFIEDPSKLYVDALMHDEVAIPSVVSLFALMNQMKVVSTSRVAEGAYKITRMIVDTYFLPMMASDALDPLRDFSDACREELDALTSGVLQHA